MWLSVHADIFFPIKKNHFSDCARGYFAGVSVVRFQQFGKMSAPPNGGSVSVLLTDLYQITMVYAYWKAGRHNCNACFEMFFRKNPFKGGFTVFAGLREIADQILSRSPCFTADDVAYIKSNFPASTPDAFFEYVRYCQCYSSNCVFIVACAMMLFQLLVESRLLRAQNR